ncbi:MAG TPA: hypothetical protein VNJ01_10655 [Bacteriovoracaceae bacterium]|nr:hypothetical protein [Bacteriovoracaceae bacterium]
MKQAVVIGSGICGLATAEVLSTNFEKVLVYEGAPPAQAHHLHVLLGSGQDCLERIFPGIKSQLLEAGCPLIDWAQDTVWENQDGSFPRYPSSVKTFSMSRMLLTSLMRQRVQRKNIEFIQQRVSGLGEVDGSLIVLAGGQNFPLETFLGRGVYKEEQFPLKLTYRSLVFKQSDLKLEGPLQYYFQIDPPRARTGGVITPIEGQRVMATLIEQEDEFTPCSGLSAYLEKASKIKSDAFTRILKDAKPVSELYQYRKAFSHRRTLNLEAMPKNVIVLGDALLSLNPVFGQGMTVSLQQAEILKELLSRPSFSAESFHRRCQKAGHFAHRLSLLGSHESGLGKRSLRAYLKLCQRHKALHHLFLRQLHSLRILP